MKNRTDKTDNSQNIFNRMLRKTAEGDKGDSGLLSQTRGSRKEGGDISHISMEMETSFRETANIRTYLY
jgi:hypothetical protein